MSPYKLSHQPSYTVNKVGGTSMGELRDVLKLTQSLIDQGESPFMVVSAFKKNGIGATKSLMAGMNSLSDEDFDTKAIHEAFSDFHKLHHEMIEEFFEGKYAQQAQEFFKEQYAQIEQSLMEFKGDQSSMSFVPSRSSNSVRDEVIGAGERLAAKFLEIFLQQNNINAEYIDDIACDPELFPQHEINFKQHASEMRQVVKKLLQSKGLPIDAIDQYVEQGIHFNGNGQEINQEDLHEAMFEAIFNALKERVTTISNHREGVAYILGGHIPYTGPNGIMVDIGSSYTDLTAVITVRAIEKLLGTEAAMYFVKDVYGVHPFNPNLFDDKDGLEHHDHISFDEADQIAESGNPILHPDVAKYAKKHKIPLHMRNISNPNVRGTTFGNRPDVTQHPFKSVVSNPNTEIIKVVSGQMSGSKGFLEAVAREFNNHGFSILSTGDTRSSVTAIIERPTEHSARQAHMESRRQLLDSLEKLRVGYKNYDMEIYPNQGPFAALSIVGDELKKDDPVDLFIALKNAGITIEMISYEKDAICMTILIDQKNEKKANEVLRDYYKNYNQPQQAA